MGEFDYDRPVAPIEKETYTIEQLFSNLSLVENEPTNFRGAIYAEPGKGKTYAGIELAQRITPAGKIIVHIYTGTNWDSYKDVPELTQRVYKKPYTNTDELIAFLEQLEKPEVRAKIPVGTIVFDEHNTMFDEDTDRITSLNSALMKKEKRVYKDPHTPEWPDRNIAKYHLKDMMNSTMKLKDINFIFLTHERDGKESLKKEPDYFNKAAQEFMRPLSCLYRLTTQIVDGNVVRVFQTQGTDQVTAKNRITGLPPFVSGPNAVEQIAEAYKLWSKAELEKKPVESAVAEVRPPEPQPEETVLPPSAESEASPQVATEVKEVNDDSDDNDLKALLGI